MGVASGSGPEGRSTIFKEKESFSSCNSRTGKRGLKSKLRFFWNTKFRRISCLVMLPSESQDKKIDDNFLLCLSLERNQES